MGIVPFALYDYCTYPIFFNKKANAATAQSSDSSRSWKVTTAGKDTEDVEEMVFTIHGILCGQDLPPIMDQYVLAIQWNS